ncbi:8-amino-7-oxononanoate synthase [Burkholderia lata]|uniref:8-amino-7-oxononanoate synthase n=2 Tax=Burkholderia TaxID=32008 RepID=UPI0014536684|nr:8-amino-7-oxononanoate synthase [Burkholderia lata]VWC41367.1 8-amino-7-oxononanoate synthase [Burkholderia lata]
MTNPLLDTLQRGLADLDAQGLRRVRRTADTACDAHMTVDGREIVGFASNDYLGLAAHPALVAAFAEGAQRYGSGSGGSHLLGGHSRAHATLEEELAAFSGGFSDAPRALYFSTGYMANLAAMTALTGKGATIFSDALNHASLIDGMRLSRANVQVYPHADTAALAALLDASDAETKLIVSDTVFSMDGDLAPLAELVALAERHGAWLVVDDAHGFGVLGPQGRGALAAAALRSPHLVYVGTLGKAAGVAGAFVIAHETVIEWMIQRARSYIFTTAAPPAVAHAVSASLKVIAGDEGDARRAHLAALIERTRALLRNTRWQPVDSHTAVQPLVIGSNDATLAAMRALDAHGLWVPAIRPPTVPVGTSRLRVSLSAAHSFDDLARLEAALIEASDAAAASVDAAPQETEQPPRSLRSLSTGVGASALTSVPCTAPPEGGAASLGAARRETAA